MALSEVVENVNDYYDRESSVLERYVAGDHIDEASLEVRRWGLTTDELFPPTFNRRFRPGDVLLHSRNLKKVASPNFSGITGEKLFVLRVRRSDLLLPALLPFVLKTTDFTEYVNRMWAGSTNKFLNKTPLMRYELNLPSVKRQGDIVELLQAAQAVNERAERLQEAQATVIRSFITTTFARLCDIGPFKTAGEMAEVKMGRQKAPRFELGHSPRPFLRVANVGNLELNLGEVQEMDFSDRELAVYRLAPGDLVLTEGDLMGPQNVGRPALYQGEIRDCAFQNTLIRFRPGPDVNPVYGLLALEGARLTGVFARTAKTSTVAHLGIKRFSQVPLPYPPKADQDGIALRFNKLLEGRKALAASRAQARLMLDEFLNGVLQ